MQPASVPAAYRQKPGNGSEPVLLQHGTLCEAQGDGPAINPNPCIALIFLNILIQMCSISFQFQNIKENLAVLNRRGGNDIDKSVGS